MFYSLLDLLVCPVCKGELALLDPVEAPKTTSMRLRRAGRTSAEGAVVGPLPARPADTPLYRLLASHAAMPDEGDRHLAVHVTEGILACVYCERWYPIRDGLPELLPDHLRPWGEDRRWLEGRLETRKPTGSSDWGELLAARAQPASAGAEDGGAHFKRAEMAIGQRSVAEDFFGPARVAPFNPVRPSFTLDLMLRFGTTVTHLDCGTNGTVLDLGVGYGWTTEWLVRLGYQTIGVDIAREYVLAGLPRMDPHLPHLIICDVENIPLREECADAVLAFDAFHHFPNRNGVMKGLARIMRPGAKIAMVEPGKQHEHHPQSIAVMKQHGILEQGLDKADLETYCEGTGLENAVHYRTDAHPHDMYTVQKAGTFQPDSLAPRALVASIQVEPKEGRAQVAEAPELTVSIFNSGDTVWLNNTDDGRGVVRLGAMLYDSDNSLLEQDYARVALPRNIHPREGVRLKFSLPPLGQPGQYAVELDMVDEGYLWFKDYAFQPVSWPLTVEGEPGGEEEPIISRESEGCLIQPMVLASPSPRSGEIAAQETPAAIPLSVAATELTYQPHPLFESAKHLSRRSREVWRVGGPSAFARAVVAYLRRKL